MRCVSVLPVPLPALLPLLVLLPMMLPVLQDRERGKYDAHSPPKPEDEPEDKRAWYHINLDPNDIRVWDNGSSDTDLTSFLGEVSTAIRESSTNELLLYVHGYNTGFADAIKTAAQLVVDTDSTGNTVGGYGPRAAVAYDWASCHDMKAYGIDLTRARGAGERLAQLLVALANGVSGGSPRQLFGVLETWQRLFIMGIVGVAGDRLV